MDTNARPPPDRLVELAHRYVSGALQFDYLSNGAGHRQSTPIRKLRACIVAKANGTARTGDIVSLYLADVATHKRLSSSEEYRLAVAARKGDVDARRWLIERHLRLVVVIARRYHRRRLPLLDLIEEGNLGLMMAINKFDPERGCRFSTYAKWWIRQSIELALMTQTSVVRIPVHVARALKRQSRARATRSEPVDADLLDEGLPSTPQYLLHDTRDLWELHHSARRDELQAFIDTVAAPEDEQPDWHLQIMSSRRHLESALSQLKDTEQRVLRSRFGLNNHIDRTLRDIAQELKLSTERVRQIQEEALSKLRNILQADHGPRYEGLL